MHEFEDGKCVKCSEFEDTPGLKARCKPVEIYTATKPRSVTYNDDTWAAVRERIR